LIDYFLFPNRTTILISSTDLRQLDLRVWGDVSGCCNGRVMVLVAAGYVLEGRHSISTDDLKDDDAVFA